MFKGWISEYRRYGLKAILFRLYGYLNGDYSKYILYKQSVAARFDLEIIKKIVAEDYYSQTKEPLDLNHPILFTEKMQWLKLFDATPQKTRLADKYAVREYVKEKVGEEYLVPLLGVWDSFDQISFAELPNQFALKLNNGCGMNVIVKDKSKFDATAAKRKFDFWIKTNYAFNAFEMQYRDINNKIIAEQYIEQSNGNLYDFKFDCFNGEPYICEFIGDRNLTKHTGFQAFVDLQWNKLNIDDNTYPIYETLPSRPDNWEEMILVAKKLCKGFSYVRVDLYSVEGKVYFGEMTFTPVGGHQQFNPPYINKQWGEKLILPKAYNLKIPK